MLKSKKGKTESKMVPALKVLVEIYSLYTLKDDFKRKIEIEKNLKIIPNFFFIKK